MCSHISATPSCKSVKGMKDRRDGRNAREQEKRDDEEAGGQEWVEWDRKRKDKEEGRR